ncbi:MAG: hypothetical protein WCC00_03755, partial [Candidatus Aminicenantales bacterium]
MKRIPALILAIASVASLAAQDAPSAANNEKTYPFILRDSPARLFTMRQVDENSLSGFRLFSDALNSELKPVLSYVI